MIDCMIIIIVITIYFAWKDNGLMSGPTKSDCRHRRFSMLIDPHQTTAAVAGESSNGNMLLSLINQLKHSEPNLLVSRTTAAENNLTVATTHVKQDFQQFSAGLITYSKIYLKIYV